MEIMAMTLGQEIAFELFMSLVISEFIFTLVEIAINHADRNASTWSNEWFGHELRRLSKRENMSSNRSRRA